MSSIADEGLAEQVANGEQQAFLSLYDRYASRVYALALRMVGDPMAAEEITQDVFLKLWARAQTYIASRGPFAAWLLTIARYAALDRLRLERRRPLLSDASDPEEVWKKLPDDKSTSDEARWQSLYFAVQALPPKQRQVIELAYYQGLSHSQIAEYLGWPVGTVKARLRLAMEKLRRQWLAQEIPDGESAAGSGSV